MRCGNVLSWKRVQGASGKLQAFGFCEFEVPEATLRCIRLLNDWMIADRSLVVKVDCKTKVLLEDYKKKRKPKEPSAPAPKKDKKEDGEIKDDDDDKLDDNKGEPLDEFTLREDRVAKAGLDAIMREYTIELSKEPLPEPVVENQDTRALLKGMAKRYDNVDNLDLDVDKKDLISMEISRFRATHKMLREIQDCLMFFV